MSTEAETLHHGGHGGRGGENLLSNRIDPPCPPCPPWWRGLSWRALSWCATFQFLPVVVGLLLVQQRVPAQSLSYTKGQNVAPAYEGWEQGPDGTKYFLFGYMNRNWEEEIDVPVGPDNGFNVGGADQGQPTHFLPRRKQ